MTPPKPLPTAESVTDMYDCTHGPVKDCPRCMNRELLKALDDAALDSHLRACRVYGRKGPIFRACEFPPCVERRALIDRAKLAAEQWGEEWQHRELDDRLQAAAEMQAEMGSKE